MCIDECKNDDIYNYEYNNFCYKECPNNTYVLEDKEDNKCFENAPQGYYLDLKNNTFRKCYEKCNLCEIGGDEINNNCIKCISDYELYNIGLNSGNCYKKCDFYFYFDENKEFHCEKTCPLKYNKMIETEKKCIDSCKNDDIYKYEYNNSCYKECQNNTYIFEDKKDNKCIEKAPEGYYIEPKENKIKKCYESCKKCEIGGDEVNNNCIECITNYGLYNNLMNKTNCYKVCQFYHYFDEQGNFHCTDKCPQKYNKLILEEKMCVNDCKNSDIYKYNYNDTCLKKCPNDTFTDENNNICYNYKNIKTTLINEINNNTTFTIEDERDIQIEKFREKIFDFNVSDDKEIVETIGNVQYQMTTSEFQKNNTNKNISTINLGDCETKLKKEYKIEPSLPLIIFKIDYFSPDTSIPIIGYEIYHPITKDKLNLTICEDILIQLNIPVNIDENNLFKYDPNSDFYNDNCFTYTTENGTDIILNDRKQEFTDNNLSLCEKNCNYTGYNEQNKQSSCDCNIKNKMDLISEIIENPNKLSNNFEDEENDSNSGASNIISLKCTKALFSKEGLKSNISSYILIIFITYFLL